jgi:hypothetical protein
VTRLLAALLLLAGCAAPERAPVASTQLPTNDELEIQAAHDELRRLEAKLDEPAVQAAVPDCARIGQLRDNICDLATRICQIAGRQPQGSTAAAHASGQCVDGTLRCKNAVERAQSRGCPKK